MVKGVWREAEAPDRCGDGIPGERIRVKDGEGVTVPVDPFAA